MNEKYGITRGDEIFENDALLNTSPSEGGSGQPFTVQADPSWQDTGVTISQGTPTTITYMKGAWTAGIIENGGQLYDANGWPGHNAPSGYPVPKAQIGALIGKIGKNGTPFLVGDGPFLIPSTSPGGKSQ